jgi:hypothetical protein
MHSAALTIQTASGAVFTQHVSDTSAAMLYAGITGAVSGAVRSGASVIGLDITEGE